MLPKYMLQARYHEKWAAKRAHDEQRMAELKSQQPVQLQDNEPEQQQQQQEQ